MFGDAFIQSLFMAYIHLYLEVCIINIDLQVSKDYAILLCCMLNYVLNIFQNGDGSLVARKLPIVALCWKLPIVAEIIQSHGINALTENIFRHGFG